MHRVFLSWSGNMSHQVALVLKDWLPNVIQALDPFVSTEDIGKGAHWGEALARELEDTDYGILCITPYNVDCPWLNFEAGALSKSIARSLVLPFLFLVDPGAIQGPLSQFQSTVCDKEDIFGLLRAINDSFKPEEKLKIEILRRQFDKWWPDLNKDLKISDDPTKEKHNEFNWLYTLEELAKVEETENITSIWVITPNLYQNVFSPTMKPVMDARLARGTSYRFIIPESALSPGLTAGIRRLTDPNKFEVKTVADHEFRSMAVTDYFILNPDQDTRRVFLELPVDPPGYWILVYGEAAMGFTDRFHKMWESGKGIDQ